MYGVALLVIGVVVGGTIISCMRMCCGRSTRLGDSKYKYSQELHQQPEFEQDLDIYDRGPRRGGAVTSF